MFRIIIRVLINIILSALELCLQLLALSIKAASLALLAKYLLAYFALASAPAYLYYTTIALMVTATSYVLMQNPNVLEVTKSSKLPVFGIIHSLLLDIQNTSESLDKNIKHIANKDYGYRFKKLKTLIKAIMVTTITCATLACGAHLLYLYCLQVALPTMTPFVKLFISYFVALLICNYSYKAAANVVIPLKIGALFMASSIVAALYHYYIVTSLLLGTIPALAYLILSAIIKPIASRFMQVEQDSPNSKQASNLNPVKNNLGAAFDKAAEPTIITKAARKLAAWFFQEEEGEERNEQPHTPPALHIFPESSFSSPASYTSNDDTIIAEAVDKALENHLPTKAVSPRIITKKEQGPDEGSIMKIVAAIQTERQQEISHLQQTLEDLKNTKQAIIKQTIESIKDAVSSDFNKDEIVQKITKQMEKSMQARLEAIELKYKAELASLRIEIERQNSNQSLEAEEIPAQDTAENNITERAALILKSQEEMHTAEIAKLKIEFQKHSESEGSTDNDSDDSDSEQGLTTHFGNNVSRNLADKTHETENSHGYLSSSNLANREHLNSVKKVLEPAFDEQYKKEEIARLQDTIKELSKTQKQLEKQITTITRINAWQFKEDVKTSDEEYQTELELLHRRYTALAESSISYTENRIAESTCQKFIDQMIHGTEENLDELQARYMLEKEALNKKFQKENSKRIDTYYSDDSNFFKECIEATEKWRHDLSKQKFAKRLASLKKGYFKQELETLIKKQHTAITASSLNPNRTLQTINLNTMESQETDKSTKEHPHNTTTEIISTVSAN